MKKCKRLIAAASALMLSLCCLPLSAAAADVSPPVPEAVSAEARIIYERFDSVEDAGLYVRENLKKHTDELHILLTSKAKTDDILNDVLGVAFAETGRGDEGDYLRLSIEGYSSYTGYVLRDQVMDIVFHYNSTLEEEAALTKKEEEILASMALDEAGADISPGNWVMLLHPSSNPLVHVGPAHVRRVGHHDVVARGEQRELRAQAGQLLRRIAREERGPVGKGREEPSHVRHNLYLVRFEKNSDRSRITSGARYDWRKQNLAL